jgi:glucoside 3-dehydrogenase (cytochrome c) hitch-hiker subunit
VDLTRRRLLRLAACAAALPGAAAFLGPWLEAAQRDDYEPKFFDKDDFAALEAFTAILIPTDDTPGARQARCAQFIDFLLQASAKVDPNMARQWRTAMQALRDAGFHTADAKAREDLVAAMARPERERGATHPAYFAYRLIKQQNTFAFYTSRQGLIECLEYKGNSYNPSFPACDHPEHHTL